MPNIDISPSGILVFSSMLSSFLLLCCLVMSYLVLYFLYLVLFSLILSLFVSPCLVAFCLVLSYLIFFCLKTCLTLPCLRLSCPIFIVSSSPFLVYLVLSRVSYLVSLILSYCLYFYLILSHLVSCLADRMLSHLVLNGTLSFCLPYLVPPCLVLYLVYLILSQSRLTVHTSSRLSTLPCPTFYCLFSLTSSVSSCLIILSLLSVT